MLTVDNPSPPVIQLLLPSSRPPEFSPLTFPLLPLAPIVSQMVISKPQLSKLRFTKGDGEAEGCQIDFPTRSLYPMLREVSRLVRTSLNMLISRLTSKATRKSSRNILSKLTCTSWVGGTATGPFGPVMDPGSDNDGELDEVPLSRFKNSLTAPSMSPVVYKSRPIFRSQLECG